MQEFLNGLQFNFTFSGKFEFSQTIPNITQYLFFFGCSHFFLYRFILFETLKEFMKFLHSIAVIQHRYNILQYGLLQLNCFAHNSILSFLIITLQR